MDLTSLQQQLQCPDLAPVETWQPKFCGDLPLLITADGCWLYQGSEIRRPAMVKLFASVLICQQQQYYLQTPAEKVRIQVEDAPFLVVDSQWQDTANGPLLTLTTNIGDAVSVTPSYPLRLKSFAQQRLPYLQLWRGLSARLNRNTYYQLIEQCTEVYCAGERHYQLKSAGYPFTLGVLS
ncbi:DUF1285 domain-containing protein [Arsukibacterium indicum]|uniref:DUF1285 domain-containing protein n=1 Tax=Arsukibacterium indicum TaxID=2848612 RepID=A0ABS6MNK4_9GAMM|nr:DUF1285 domain-containing protein [Arsukibacterium indicum]MBV2130385.1 DUF1285 domain-containing protein [Arsukibacterium indicum]